MSDVGSTAPGDWILAAECALGLLDGDEKARADRRLEEDPEFAALVSEWERRFAGLAAGLPEIAPPADVKRRIDAALFEEAEAPNAARANAPPRRASPLSSYWRNIAFWRFAAAGLAASLVATVLALYAVVRQSAPTGVPAPLIAVLTTPDAPSLLVEIDDAGRRVTVAPFDLADVADDNFPETELWLIPAGASPRSLGLINPDGAELSLSAFNAEYARRVGASIAVSLEPAGGSPTGAPTGPIIAMGAIRTTGP